MEIIEYYLDFTYKSDDELVWIDNFKLDTEWSIARIKGLRIAQKSYFDRTPNYNPNQNYDIALYYKNKWIYLEKGVGKTITSSDKNFNIPNLEIKTKIYTPNLAIYRFKFDFHILLTLIQMSKIAIIHENKILSLIKSQVTYKSITIKIYENILSYRGREHNIFKEFANEIEELYKTESKEIGKIYDVIESVGLQPKDTHISIAFKTWYNAKRENQRIWPIISRKPSKNSVEFPKDSGIYYSYPNSYIGLAKRTDFNTELYIPRIYSVDHENNKKSLLYMYKNNKTKRKIEKVKINLEVIDGVQVQILDKEGNRIKIVKNNEWINDKGNKLENVIALPYNYTQILHDYAKINMLEIGPFMDLTHIGIVNINTKEKITFPKKINYIGKTFETHRLLTLKTQRNVKINWG